MFFTLGIILYHIGAQIPSRVSTTPFVLSKNAVGSGSNSVYFINLFSGEPS